MCSYTRKVYACGHKGDYQCIWCLHMEARNRNLRRGQPPRYICGLTRQYHPDEPTRLYCRSCHRIREEAQRELWDEYWDGLNTRFRNSNWDPTQETRAMDLKAEWEAEYEAEMGFQKEEMELERGAMYRDFPRWIGRTLAQAEYVLGILQ